eukprot:g20427.t1
MSCWPLKAQPLSSRWFTAELQFPEALAELGSWLDHGRAAVVKPRHAACGQGLTVLQPGATEPERLQALEDAFKVECKKGETWQLYQVAKGVGVEEVYPSEPDRPLELKLQTIWGRVLGGTIHTSQDVWITADGHVLRCDARKGGIRRKYGPLPEWILDGGLESLLKDLLGEVLVKELCVCHLDGHRRSDSTTTATSSSPGLLCRTPPTTCKGSDGTAQGERSRKRSRGTVCPLSAPRNNRRRILGRARH